MVCVHHFAVLVAVGVSRLTLPIVEQTASFASVAVGKAATHFGDWPHLLRRPPFSQHRHAPQDFVSTSNL